MNRITDEAMLECELGKAEREQKRIDMEEGLCSHGHPVTLPATIRNKLQP
jgi:hypothetical protein